MNCRACNAPLRLLFADLGTAPPSNNYVTPEALAGGEAWYPLRVLACESCWLVQAEGYTGDGPLFDAEYAYFSSYSSSWVEHARRYVDDMVRRFRLGSSSLVVEVASNDGYLLQHVRAKGIPCLGVEPTASTAAAARAKGIEVREAFFGRATADALVAEGRQADLLVANNVLAHVPDINDFAAGFARLLKPDGVATFEFPHLVQLVRDNLFDTIYHEHYSYLSLRAVESVFARVGLSVFDVERLRTHGGSLRVFAQRADTGKRPAARGVQDVRDEERREGVGTPAYYSRLQADAVRVKHDLLRFLLDARAAGKKVAGYGAAAKGNTLLNFAGIRADLLPYVVDANPHKQGKHLPGSRIPIVREDHLKADRPDYVLILPWNLRDEIQGQLQYVRGWGGRFVLALPRLHIE